MKPPTGSVDLCVRGSGSSVIEMIHADERDGPNTNSQSGDKTMIFGQSILHTCQTAGCNNANLVLQANSVVRGHTSAY